MTSISETAALADKWRLAQAKTLADHYEAGRLNDLPLDAEGKIIPTNKALRWAESQPSEA